MPDDEILTSAQACELIQVHPEYLRKMVRTGRVPAHRLPGGRSYRYFRSELVEWLRSSTVLAN